MWFHTHLETMTIEYKQTGRTGSNPVLRKHNVRSDMLIKSVTPHLHKILFFQHFRNSAIYFDVFWRTEKNIVANTLNIST